MKIIFALILLCGSALLISCGDDDDPPPQPHVKVFVTSGSWLGRLNTTGGLAAADAICTDFATRLGGQPGTWTAWLSDSTTNAADRINDGGGAPYQLIDGTVIADNMVDLLDGTLDAPILIDEAGNTVGGSFEVWTGTVASGTNPSISWCSDWTSENTAQKGLIGRADRVDATWSSVFADACDLFNRLYCVADANSN